MEEIIKTVLEFLIDFLHGNKKIVIVLTVIIILTFIVFFLFR